MNESSIALQIDREADAVAIGAKRYWNHVTDTGHSDTKVGEELARRIIIPLATSIRDWSQPKDKRGQHMRVSRLVTDVDPRELALLTVRVALHQNSIAMSFPAACVMLGGYVEEHVIWSKMQKPAERKAYAKKVEKSLKRTKAMRHKRAVVRHIGRKLGVDVNWSKREKAVIGGHLLTRLVQTVPHYFETKRIGRGRRERKELHATQALLDWLQKNHERCAALHPVQSPMVIEPTVWESTRGGGYLTRDNPLVKNVSHERLDSINATDLVDTLDAVNKLQGTAWRINTNISELAARLVDSGSQLGDLPNQNPEPLPAFPVAKDGDEVDPAMLREWKRKAHGTHTRNASLGSKRLAMYMLVEEARTLSEYPELYYVYELDWRGRAYPMAGHVSPQGSDLGKALLLFSEGRRLGDNGGYWLAVHLANSFGHDKVSLDDRAQWAVDNTDAIVNSASDPEVHRFWAEADAPWRFLAACYEWAGYLLEGDEYVCSLPVGMDGSCNGLQHFSAALRDEVGGSAVNLVPHERPADIYQRVADKTTELLLEDIEVGPNEKAAYWVGRGVDRKLVKRPVMTLPYGVTAYGMREQIFGEVMDEKRFDECIYLAGVVERAIGEVVVAAPVAMKFLQDIAAVFVEAELPIRWTTPLGFEVQQAYHNTRGDRVKVRVGAQRVELTLTSECHGFKKRKQVSGISPNVVHSWDAAHMMHTVLKCRDAGIRSLAMVHDSYATTPGEVDVLSLLLREAFVEQYHVDVLADFLEQTKAQLPSHLHENLPALRDYGNLEIEQVLGADYFFA